MVESFLVECILAENVMVVRKCSGGERSGGESDIAGSALMRRESSLVVKVFRYRDSALVESVPGGERVLWW